ncbi:MAG TPA: hypothetical protein VIQ03_04810 [Gammaproteobacteria bacterium]
MNKLNDLVQEIIDFGDVIAFAENPADRDFQNACRLFSDYLDWKFKEIKNQLEMEGSEQQAKWIADEMEKLGQLISPANRSTTSYVQWASELLMRCVEFRKNSRVAVA